MAGEKIIENIEYEQIFDVADFKKRYNAWNGTALGLAHTMMQTASFRPNNYSKKLKNLFYV
jgi:phytoene desaturase